MLLAAGHGLAADLPRDLQVIRQGTVLAAYAGDDAGHAGSGLRLTSLGRWRDDRGVHRFTIWRVRNAGAASRAIRLDAPGSGFAIALTLAGRTDLFLRSPVTDGTATHRLFEGANPLDAQSAQDAVWADATPVVPASGVNRPPVILSMPDPVAEVGQAYRYPVLVFDPDNDPVSLSAPSAPAGYRFTSGAGWFDYRATAAQVGLQSIRIQADDSRGGVAQQPYALRVVADFCTLYPIALPEAALATLAPPATVDRLPRGTGPGQFSWLTWAGSPSAPVLAASLFPPGDSHAYVDPDEPADRQPDAGDWVQGAAGSMNADAVRDAMTALRQHEIVVPAWRETRGTGNRLDYRIQRFARIRLTGHDLTGQGSLSFVFLGWHDCYADAPIARDQALQTPHATPLPLALAGDDADGDPLTFRIVEAPRRGALSGAAPNLVYTPAAGHAGLDRLLFVANDGTRTSEPGLVEITTLPPTNREPVAIAQTLATDEDRPLAITLQGSDPDGDDLVFRIIREPARGVLSGSPPNLVYQPRENLSGTDEFYFRVSDGRLESPSARIVVQVRPVNDPPVALPVEAATDEDTPVAIRLRGEDIDSTALTYTIVAPPARGTLEGTPPDLTYRPAVDFAGADAFTFRVRDGEAESAPATASLLVRPKNDAPRITSTPVTQGTIGIEWRYDVDATDVDGDVLAFVLVRSPPGMSIDRGTGVIRWIPAASETYPVEVIVDAVDPGGLFDKQRFLLNAAPANRPPAFQTTPPGVAQVGAAYAYDADATDPDGDTVSYALADAPAGMAVDAASGIVAWTPLAAQFGTRTATLFARDGRGGEAMQRLTIDVRAANRPPVITSTAPTTATVGVAYAYPVVASDPDGDALAYALVTAPAGMAIDAASGAIAWVPAATQAGPNPVVVRVSDARGSTADQSFAVLAGVNDPPEIVSIPDYFAIAGERYRYDGDAVDPNPGDRLAFALPVSPPAAMVDPVSGVVDWPVPTADADGITSLNPLCRLPSREPGALNAMVKWHWTQESALSAPLVVPLSDTDGSGRIDEGDKRYILVGTFTSSVDSADARIRAFDGATGTVVWTQAAGTQALRASTSLAAADVDRDGRVEIFGIAGRGVNAGEIVAFDWLGRQRWVSSGVPDIGGQNDYSSPTLADIDADGVAEIMHRATVVNSDGSIRWARPDLVPWNRATTYAVDLDGDGLMEVITGPHVLSAGGDLLFSLTSNVRSMTAIGNFDSDEHAEIVLSEDGGGDDSSPFVSLFQHDGRRIWGPVSLNGSGAGPPTVADFDGDGLPEIGVSSARRYSVIDTDGRVLWQRPIVDASSRTTGSTVFDFDGDGAAEVAFADEVAFRIFDGPRGEPRLTWPNASWTAAEFPVVADVDADGAAEIVIVSDRSPDAGIRVIEAAQGHWIGTRAIWNQYNYTIDNINDDMTVPATPPRGWLTHNSFRLNAFPAGDPLGLPDLAVYGLHSRVDSDRTALTIANRGIAPAPASRVVIRRAGVAAPVAGIDLPALAPGEVRPVEVPLPSSVSAGDALAATIDEPGVVPECEERNNTATGTPMVLSVEDGARLEDRQAFRISAARPNRPPSIEGSTLPAAITLHRYVARIVASDPDVGDAVRFTALAAPQGLSIESPSGRIFWIPSATQAGAHALRVRATDLGGLAVEREYTVVVAPNRPPVITTPAPQTPDAVRLTVFELDVDAVDPDGDAVAFRAIGPTLPGLSVDSASGLVRWPVPDISSGLQTITIEAVDDFLGSATLQFQVRVVAPGPNNPPRFTSTPITSAVVDAVYVYNSVFTDPDRDPLVHAAVVLPDGMQALRTSSGVRLTWRPTAQQRGSHPVRLEVSDGRGGVGSHAFTITVYDADNRPPSFTSTPAATAKVGRVYRYPASAVDPNGDAVAYSLTRGPAGMSVDPATGLVQWTPTPAQPGPHPVTLRASDGLAFAEQSWSIEALDAATPLAASVEVTPSVVAPSGTVLIRLAVSGAAGPVATQATITPPGTAIVLDPDGETTLQAPATPGCRTIEVRVSDGAEPITRSTSFCVQDAADTTPPRVELLAPADGAEVTAPAAVRATVADANLASWRLAVRPANSPGATPTILAQGATAVTDQVVGAFDPTLLLNGQYALILQATDVSGNTTSDSIVLRVTGDMKVGHFSLTFEDVSIPVAGIPIRVTRTYDTRQRGESLDFGFGWSVDYQNVRVRESAKPGFSWRNFQPVPGPFGEWCTRSNGDRVVTVTLPDGAVESFRAKAEPECTALVPEGNVHLVFEPIDGTDSRLEQTDYGLLRVATTAGSGVYNLVDPGSPTEPVDPDSYRLTMPDGLVYELEQDFGIRRVIEPGGQTLTYSPAGVVHSSGVGVRFMRDAQGRIRDMVLPDGEVLSYAYTAAGDLASFTDAGDQATRFSYGLPAFPHYLTEIRDPRNARVLRNEYDNDGRLVATIDAEGHRIEYEHDVDGRREQVRDRRGNLVTYVYDDNGRVLAETNALGETTRRTYDADGNVLTETDPLGHTTAYTYDPRGNRLTETNALGQTTISAYDARNNLLTQVDALGRATIRNVFRPNSNFLVEMQDATGASTRFGYDLGLGSGQTGELTVMTDAAGAATRYELDGAGRGWRIAEVDALGQRTTYAHDAMGRVVSETRTRVVDGVVQSLVTRYTLDAEGRVTRTEHPDGTATTTEYDGNGKPVRECDALGRCTVTHYDDRGNLSVVEHPDGTSESTSYDPNGNVVARTDRAGRLTSMVYDAANRLVETIHPDDTPADDTDNPRTRNEYDAAGRIVATIDELGRRTEYRYDAAGRRTHVIEPAIDGSTATTVTAYDAAGQRTAVTDALGRTTRLEYDAAGRLTTTIHPDAGPEDGNDANNPRTRVNFDVLGRKTAETDPDGRRTEYGYDALGRLVRVVLAAGTPSATTTTYAYDEQGNRTTQTDAEGRSTRFTFDVMGRESSRTLPLGQVERKTWTAAGEPASLTDFNGRTMRWEHDAAGRATEIDYPNDPDVSLSYTPTGQRSTAVDGHGTVTQQHDARDRLVRRTDAAGRVIEYTYDARGNLLSRVTASQSLVYAYDARDRLLSVTATVAGGTPRTTRYTYDEVGLRTSMTAADGTRTTYSYDRRNRLVGLVQRTAAAALLFSASYTVDATGLRTTAQESDASGVVRSLAWTYDALKRLTGEAIDHRDDARDRKSTWTYDRVGNRLTQQVTLGTGAAARSTVTAYAYDANDRLTQESASENGGPAQLTTYAYDTQGNTLRKTAPGGVTEYAWDDANRLVEQREGGNRTTYRYDADGLRIGRTTFPVSGTPTRTDYLVDPTFAYANVIERFEGEAGAGAAAPKLAAVFTFGDGIVGQTTCTPTPTSGPHDCPAASERFIHADGFGSTRFLTSPTGIVTDRIDYDAFGNEIAREGATGVEHLYRGEQFDPNLGWYYLRARYMDPARGRFASLDPFAGFSVDPPSLHKYIYAHDNPLNGRDPSGYQTLMELGSSLNTLSNLYTVASAAFDLTTGNYVGAAEGALDIVYGKFSMGAGGVAKLNARAEAVFARVWARGKRLKLQAEPSSRVLGENLDVVGFPRPIGAQAHHLVGASTEYGKRSRMLLQEKFKINVNSPLNGVWLPDCKGPAGVMTIHCGKHAEAYERLVFSQLSASNTREEAISALAEIRRMLLHGEIPLNSAGIVSK